MYTLLWLIVWAIADTPNVDAFNEGWNGWGIVLVALIVVDIITTFVNREK
jgi:hypothetical protein